MDEGRDTQDAGNYYSTLHVRVYLDVVDVKVISFFPGRQNEHSKMNVLS